VHKPLGHERKNAVNARKFRTAAIAIENVRIFCNLRDLFAPSSNPECGMDIRNFPSREQLGTVSCLPVPRWVAHDPYTAQASENTDYVINGICRLLSDTQIDLCGSDIAWHHRTAQRVVTRAGAEQIAQFRLEFDPSFQRLEIHFVRIVRGQAQIEHAKPEAFQILQRETSLERLTLTGHLTASLLIPDVRIDDVLEVCFTSYGSNPVLGGKYAAWIGFDPFNPWLDARYRMLRPLAREISTNSFNKPPNPDTTLKNDVEESRWCLIGQQRRVPEAFTPPWLILAPALQQSEFKSWNEIARLFAPSYEAPEIPEGLTAEIDRLAAIHQSQADRAAEWLRFVQRELRYFALALGEGGLVPRELATIWSTRFGDCKDAALLYIAGARRLGLDACAALISTTHGQWLDRFLPSPWLFNHCIVRLNLNGTLYWLDPTMQPQSGSLENIYQAHTGWALPLMCETAELESLGVQEPLHLLRCEYELHFGPKRDSPVSLQRSIEHRSWAADRLRNVIANSGTADYAKHVLTELQATWPNILQDGSIAIHDDQAKNCLTTTFNYQIRDCWKPGTKGALSFAIMDAVPSGELGALQGTERRAEIYLGRPRKVTSRIKMHMPCGWSGSGWYRECHEQGLRYVSRLMVDGKVLQSWKELVIDAWSIPAAQNAAYGRVVSQVSQNLLTIRAYERFGRLRPTGWYGTYRSLWYMVVWFLLMLGLAFFKHG
jgi:transglutaminase-like putative cysteine protease